MTTTSHQDETERLLAFLTGTGNDDSLVSTTLGSPSDAPASAPASTSSARPLNFSSAFSQSSSRPRRSSALVASHKINESFASPSFDGFEDYSFLTQPSDGGEYTQREQGGGGGDVGMYEGDMVAGPGPNSIAAAVARNAIQGLEQYELPTPPPLPQAASSMALKARPRARANRSQQTVETVAVESPLEPEPKRKRGRPRTKPLKDPNAPPKKRGRPRKNPSPGTDPVGPPIHQASATKATSAKTRRSQNSSTELQDEVEDGGRSGSESGFQGGAEYETDSSSRSHEAERTGGDDSTRKTPGNKARKLIEPPLIPRVFRKVKKKQSGTSEEKNGEMEALVPDLDVHDLLEGREQAVPEEREADPGLTEEQKRELQRALHPTFVTRLLETLEVHSQQYDRAYKALQEELLAVQVEESFLEHVKEVALATRNNIRYPPQTIEEIDPTSRQPL